MTSNKLAKLSEALDQNVIDRIERITHIGHWTLDVETNALFWSEQVFTIHGLSPDYYTPDVMTAIDAYVQEDREYVGTCLQHAIENAENFVFECRIKRVDGEIRIVLSSGEVEIGEDGRVRKIFGTIQDITDLKLEQERYELALSSSNTAIWDWNIQDDTIHWYGASSKTLGYPNNESLPETSRLFYSKLLHEDSRKKLTKAFAEHFQTRNEFALELQFKHPDGETSWMMACGSAQWNNEGRAIRVIGSLSKIDKLKTAEAKILRSNSDLDQFASIAAHDLQQPLRSISGFLEILEDKYGPDLPKEAQEYIQHSIIGAQDMSALIADLLEYSRLETDGIKNKHENVTKIIRNAIRHLLGVIGDSGAKITFDDMPNAMPCDAYKLQRVFYNLIENAIKYRSQEKPQISITCTEEKEGWHFVVQDNGIGVRKDKIDDIFQMFQRLHNKNKYKGTGIGLSICKKIIDLHGGNIWAESTLGEGTAFNFTIPKANLQQQ